MGKRKEQAKMNSKMAGDAPQETYETVAQYLDGLRDALKGADRATIQDALADAEEHLYSAQADIQENSPDLSETEALQRAIEEYGTPGEIAAAYREIEERLQPALARPKRPSSSRRRSALARFFGIYADPSAWGGLLYLLFSLVTGVLYFSWATTGLATSLGVMILIIGVPFTVLFLLSVRGIVLVEGRLVEALLGVRMPRRASFARQDAGWWARLKPLLLGKRTWLGMLYMILQLPLGVIYFTLFICLIALSLSLFAAPVAELFFDFPLIMVGSESYDLPAWAMPLSWIVALILATGTMHAARWLGWLHGRWAKMMLVRDET